MQILQGIVVSPGVASGEILVVDDHKRDRILPPDNATVARRAIELENARQVAANHLKLRAVAEFARIQRVVVNHRNLNFCKFSYKSILPQLQSAYSRRQRRKATGESCR